MREKVSERNRERFRPRERQKAREKDRPREKRKRRKEGETDLLVGARLELLFVIEPFLRVLVEDLQVADRRRFGLVVRELWKMREKKRRVREKEIERKGEERER